MEIGSIERELYIEASPEVVFEVVSDPQHVRQWWPDEAHYKVVPGEAGEIVFGDPGAGGKVVAFTVLEAMPPRTFTFRWTQPTGEPATPDNSLLVTFDLLPSGEGTLLKLTETGFRDEPERAEHVTGWDFFLPRLTPYVASLRGKAPTSACRPASTTAGDPASAGGPKPVGDPAAVRS